MTKWDYDAKGLPDWQPKLNDVLNKLGDDDWELVQIDLDRMVGYFKRPKVEVEEIDDCCTTITAGCGCSCTT